MHEYKMSRYAKNNYILPSINAFIVIALIYSLVLLRNYNIFYVNQYNSNLMLQGYNYNSLYLVSSLLFYILFNVILIYSIRKEMLQNNRERDTQILTIILMNLFFLIQGLLIISLQNIQSVQITMIKSIEPFDEFLNFASVITLVIFILFLIISLSDYFTKLNGNRIHFQNLSNEKVENELSKDLSNQQKSYHTFITKILNVKNGLILTFLNIFFLSLTIIYSYLIIYFNNKFISVYIANYKPSTNNILNQPTYFDFTDTFGKIAIISFVVFLTIFFFTTRKIILDYSEKFYSLSLILFGVFLFLLLILFNYLSKLSFSKFDPVFNTDGVIGSYSSYINSLFYSLNLITLSFLAILVVFLFFRLVVFNKRFFNSNGNMKFDKTRYRYGIFSGHVLGSDNRKEPMNGERIADKPTIFINDKNSPVRHLICPKCGIYVSEKDTFCEKCGTRL